MHALASALAIPLPYAIGIMTLLWEHAAQHTPRGDIGSLPDEAIRQACCFPKKGVLIGALVKCGWLDRDEDHGLVIHDWPDHCEQSVKKWLEYNHKKFLPIYGKYPEKLPTMGGDFPPSREVKAEVEAKAVCISRKSRSSLLTNQQAVWFARCWAVYWRRVARGTAEKAFADAVTTEEDFRKVMAALELQAPWYMTRDSDKRPYFATWLNQGRWADDPDISQVMDSKSRDELSRHKVLEAALERRGL